MRKPTVPVKLPIFIAVFFYEVLTTSLSPQCFYAANHVYLTNGEEPGTLVQNQKLRTF